MMKTWGKCCILYITFITLIIFIVSSIILLMKVNTNPDYNSGIMFIHQNGLWATMKILYTPKAHSYIEDMFNPTFTYQGVNGALYFSTGINLLLVAFPFFAFISFFVIKKMLKIIYYPIPENLIEDKNHIKLELKKLKKNYKLSIKNSSKKQETVDLTSGFITEKIYLKNEKNNIKNEIKMDYQLRKKSKNVKNARDNNEI